MDDEVELSMTLPLDTDGFLRRECPTCEREFKWFNSDEGQGETVAVGGYYCPYCGVQASVETWNTQSQVALVEAIAYREVVAPELRKLGKEFDKIGRASGGLIKTNMKIERPEDPDPLTEADDMRRVDFPCHSREPLKIVEDWNRIVYCLVCGTETTSEP